MTHFKRTKILTNAEVSLPWSENPKEARRLYQRIYREAHRTSVEEALEEHLGLRKRKRT